MTINYWAIATWNGQQWDVRIEDHDERHRGDTQADNLELVVKNASAILAFYLGCHPDHLTLGQEIRLPTPATAALDAAEAFIASAADCLQGAVRALRQAGVPGSDITTILAARKLDATSLEAADLRPATTGPADPLAGRRAASRGVGRRPGRP